MKVAFIGYENSGKKSILKILTGQDIKSRGKKIIDSQLIIRDERIDRLCNIYNPKKTVYPTHYCQLFTDINEINSKKTETYRQLSLSDVIVPIIREFKDDSVYHFKGSINYKRDLDSIVTDLIIQDLSFVEKRLENIKKMPKKNVQKDYETNILLKFSEILQEGMPLFLSDLNDNEREYTRLNSLISAKLILPIINIGEDQIKNIDNLTLDFQKSSQDKAIVPVFISVKTEYEISQISDPLEQKEFMELMGLSQSAIDSFVRALYDQAGNITFFTVGSDEVRGWTIEKGTHAPQAARAIHSDMERGFIRAEVMKHEDILELGSEEEVKKQGKFYVKGKDYIVEDGDIFHVRSGI